MRPMLVTFVGGEIGAWTVERVETVAGAPLESTARLEVIEGKAARPHDGRPAWILRGVTSNERYVTRSEHDALVTKQERLGRAASTRAALIPISKSDAWWELPQDERRRIFEESSHHVATGLEYLPAVARRLHHSRDLGEPFDFLTWFDFAPMHASAFEELVDRLRETEEWAYVEREIDIRLFREPVDELGARPESRRATDRRDRSARASAVPAAAVPEEPSRRLRLSSLRLLH
jgi:hypothetical protein